MMGKKWADGDDELFIDLLEGYVMEQNLTYGEAIERISADLERTVLALKFRWCRNIRPFLKDTDLVEKIRKNSGRNFSDKPEIEKANS